MRKLGTLDISGTAHDVCIGNSSDHPALGGAAGVYESDHLRIWLEAGLPKRKIEEVLTHETLHAIWYLAGVNYATAAALGLSADDPRLAAWEEMLVRILTPHVKSVFGLPKVCK